MSLTGGVTIDVDTAALDALIARAAGVEALVAKYTALVEAEAKRLAPVETGHLRDEIHSELTAMAGTVISDVPYSAAQEYGTARQAGTAFMRPALERYREAFLAEVAALFGG
jgi:HK97 gp10 family phage protein